MSYGRYPYGGVGYAGSDVAEIPADTKPTLAVEVAFTTDALDPNPAWVDITGDVRSWNTTRGRTRELERFQPGRATVVLGNLSRQYDSVNAAGPWYGYIKPMRRIRIRETFSGVTYPVFDGFVDRWQLDYPNVGTDATATVTATDAFKIFARTDLPQSVYRSEVEQDGPVAWWRLGDPATITSGFDQTTGGRTLTFQDNPIAGEALVVNDPNGSTFFDHAEEGSGNVVEGSSTTPIPSFPFSVELTFRSAKQSDALSRTLFFLGGNGSPATRWVEVFLRESAIGTPGGLTLLMTDNSGTTTSQTTSNGRWDDKSIHHVVIVVDSATFATIYVDGVDATSGDSTVSLSLPSGTVQIALGNVGNNYPTAGEFGADAEVQDVALYDYALSTTRITAHYNAMNHPWQSDQPDDRLGRVLDEAEWPAGLREIDAGNVALQSADLDGQTVLEHAQKVGETEFGLLFVTRDGKVRLIDRAAQFARTPGPAIFGDSGSEIGYRGLVPDDGDAVIRNRATISRLNGVAKTDQDTASVDEFGRFDYTLDGLLHSSDSHSAAYATFVVDEYKDPRRRITSLRLGPPAVGAEATLSPLMLGIELGDAITVRNRPLGGGATFEQVCVVEGIEHDDPQSSVERTTTLILSPEFSGSF